MIDIFNTAFCPFLHQSSHTGSTTFCFSETEYLSQAELKNEIDIDKVARAIILLHDSDWLALSLPVPALEISRWTYSNLSLINVWLIKNCKVKQGNAARRSAWNPYNSLQEDGNSTPCNPYANDRASQVNFDLICLTWLDFTWLVSKIFPYFLDYSFRCIKLKRWSIIWTY